MQTVRDSAPPGNAGRWPQRDIEAANERFAAAAREERGARVAGDAAAVDRAIVAGWDAMADRQRFRTEASEGTLGLLRITDEENPEALSAILERVPVIAQLVSAVLALEARHERGAR